MSIEDQLRQAGNRLNTELEQVPVPGVPQRRSAGLRMLAIAAVVTITVGGAALWLTRGSDGEPAAPAVTTPISSTTSTTLDVAQPGQPQPSGPTVAVAEGTYEGTDKSWMLTAFVSEHDDVCMRLGGMTCGPIPSTVTPLSAPSRTTDDLSEPRLSCVYGALHSVVAEVMLRYADGSDLGLQIYNGGGLPASFYAYCWAGGPDPTSVAVLDANANSLAEQTLIPAAP